MASGGTSTPDEEQETRLDGSLKKPVDLEIAEIHSGLKEIKRAVDLQSKAVSNSETEKIRMKCNLDQATKENETLIEKLNKNKMKHNDLKSKYEIANEDIIDKEKEVRELQEKVKVNQKLNAKLLEAENNLEKQKRKRKQHSDQLEKLTAKVQDLEAECKNKDSLISHLKMKVANAVEKVDALKKAEDENVILRKRSESLQQECLSLEQELEKTNQALHTVGENLRNEQISDTQSKQRIVQLQKKIEQQRATLITRQKQLAQARASEVKLQETLDDINSKHGRALSTLSDLQDENKQLTESRASLERALRLKSKAAKENKAEIKTLQDDKKNLQEKLQENENLLKKNKSNYEKLELDMNEAMIKDAHIINNLVEEVQTKNDIVHSQMKIGVGVASLGNLVEFVIERNMQLPVTAEITYDTSSNDQTEIQLEIYAGERPIQKYCRYLGSLTIDGLTPACVGENALLVKFEFASNDYITVIAQEKLGTKKKSEPFHLNIKGLLSEETIQTMVDEAKASKDQDAQEVTRIKTWKNYRKYCLEKLYEVTDVAIKKRCHEFYTWLNDNMSAEQKLLEKEYAELKRFCQH